MGLLISGPGGFTQMRRFTAFCLVLVMAMSTCPLALISPSFANDSGPPTIVAFSENHLVSVNDAVYAHHVEVSIAISDNGTIFAGWKNSETHNGPGARVSISKSVDGGDTWTWPYDMPMFGGAYTRQSDPWLVWHNGSIYYSYLEFSVAGEYFTQITVAKSNDYGNTWTPVKASCGDYFADKETMTIDSNGTIYIAYDDVDTSTNGNVTVRLSRSINGGETFQETSIIAEPEFYHLGPYLALEKEDNVFVAWTWAEGDPETGIGGNLYFDKSYDMGATFGKEEFINSDGNYSAYTIAGGRPAKTTLPLIMFDSTDRLYVLWADYREDSFDVYVRYSDDFGRNWSDRIRVNPTVAGDQWNPDMDIDSQGRLHIVYYDEQSGYYRPYYRVLSFTGSNRDVAGLTSPIVIANASTPSDFTRPGEYFAVRLDAQDVPQVVWSDGRNGEMDIYYAHGLTQSQVTTTTTTLQPNPLNLVLAIGVALFIVVCVVLIITLHHRMK